MKIKIDKEKCTGCAACVSLCPKYFKLNSDGKSMAKKEKVDPKDEISVREAADSCPTSAIKLVEK